MTFCFKVIVNHRDMFDLITVDWPLSTNLGTPPKSNPTQNSPPKNVKALNVNFENSGSLRVFTEGDSNALALLYKWTSLSSGLACPIQ